MSAKTRPSAAAQPKLSFTEAVDSFLIYLAIERGHSENYQLLNPENELAELENECRSRGVSVERSIALD